MLCKFYGLRAYRYASRSQRPSSQLKGDGERLYEYDRDTFVYAFGSLMGETIHHSLRSSQYGFVNYFCEVNELYQQIDIWNQFWAQVIRPSWK